MPDPKIASIDVSVSVAWWWPLYCAATVLVVAITGRAPAPQTIERVALRAVRTRLRSRSAAARELA